MAKYWTEASMCFVKEAIEMKPGMVGFLVKRGLSNAYIEDIIQTFYIYLGKYGESHGSPDKISNLKGLLFWDFKRHVNVMVKKRCFNSTGTYTKADEIDMINTPTGFVDTEVIVNNFLSEITKLSETAKGVYKGSGVWAGFNAQLNRNFIPARDKYRPDMVYKEEMKSLVSKICVW